MREASRLVEEAQALIHKNKCGQGKEILDRLNSNNHELYNFYLALGDYYKCVNNETLAKENWQRSLDLSPAYLAQVKYLKENLK